MASKLKKKLARQVAAETVLRFNPEVSTLRQQIRGVKGELKSGVRQEKNATKGIVQAVEQVRPSFDRSTAQAVEAVDQVRSRLQGDFAGLGEGAATIVAASARDDEGTRRRLAERLATSKQDLSQRELDAVSGQALAIRNLRGQAASTIGGLRNRLSNIGKEAGAYQAGRFGELTGDVREQRNDNRQKAADRRSREKINAEDNATSRANAQDRAANGSKPKVATPTQIGSVQDKIDQAVAVARPLVAAYKKKNGGGRLTQAQRVELQRLIEAGVPSETLADGTKDPGVKSQPPRYTSIALDILNDGALSKKNKQILRKRIPGGVRKLEVPRKKKAKKKPLSSAGGGTVNAGAGAKG